jgi:hypothetical protein
MKEAITNIGLIAKIYLGLTKILSLCVKTSAVKNRALILVWHPL